VIVICNSLAATMYLPATTPRTGTGTLNSPDPASPWMDPPAALISSAALVNHPSGTFKENGLQVMSLVLELSAV